MTTSTYTVTGMSCSHCEGAIRSEVSELPGIENIDVSAATGILIVTAAGELKDADVIAAVDEAGYQAERAAN